MKRLLEPKKAKHIRKSLLGDTLGYDDQDDNVIDQYESSRDFIRTLEHFLSNKAERLAKLREHLGMDPAREAGDGVDWAVVDNGEQ